MSLNENETKKILEALRKADDAQFLCLLDDVERCVFCARDNEKCRCDQKRPRYQRETTR